MTMNRWIFPLALCFLSVSSNDARHHEKFCEDVESCDTQTCVAPLGASVLLPCTIKTNNLSWVLWEHEVKLVNVSSIEGDIQFLDPRNGRLKAFPNQASQGNFSIVIDQLEDSDLGCYRCNHKGACLQVELVQETKGTYMWLLIYICAGVATAFILLSFCSYLIFSLRKQRTANNPAGASIAAAGASAPPQEISIPAVQEVEQGVHNSVYENDNFDLANYLGDLNRGHCGAPVVSHASRQNEPAPSASGIYPNLNQINCELAESQKVKLRFHRELMNRLRQASFSRHHYVNQHELRNQQVMSAQPQKRHRGAGKQKASEAEDNYDYKNPIYNRSTEQLNQL